MAKGVKKRLEENQQRLKVLLYIVLGSIGVHVVVRLIIFRASVSWVNYLMFIIASLTAVSIRQLLAALAEPTYNSSFELVDSGQDLSKKQGIVSYYHDVLYLCCASLVLSSLSDYFWFILLIIPGVLLYFLITKLIIPFMSKSSEEEMQDKMMQDEGYRKKVEKAQKRAERRRIKYK